MASDGDMHYMEERMRERFINVNGVSLHLVEAGEPQAPLVILLHGFPDFWRGWDRQIPALAEAGFRVWVPDQRGYNLSDKPADVAAYGLDLLALDVVGLMDEAGVEKACVAGHDWGGAVAWWLGLHHAHRLDKLAILNSPHPAAFTRFLRQHRSQRLKSWYMQFFQLPRLPELTSRKLGALALRRSSRPGAFSDADLAAYREAWSRPGAMKAMLDWYRAGRRKLNITPITDPVVTTSTHILWGEDDRFFDPHLAQLSLDLCADGRLTMIPGAGHWVQREATDVVNTRLIEFFR